MSTPTIESFARSVVRNLDASESLSDFLKLRVHLLSLAASIYDSENITTKRSQAQMFEAAHDAVEAVFHTHALLFPGKDPKVSAVQDVAFIRRPKTPNTSPSRVAERLVSLAYVLTSLPNLPAKASYLVPSRARDILLLAVPLLNSIDFAE